MKFEGHADFVSVPGETAKWEGARRWRRSSTGAAPDHSFFIDRSNNYFF